MPMKHIFGEKSMSGSTAEDGLKCQWSPGWLSLRGSWHHLGKTFWSMEMKGDRFQVDFEWKQTTNWISVGSPLSKTPNSHRCLGVRFEKSREKSLQGMTGGRNWGPSGTLRGYGRHVNGGVPQALRDAGLELRLAPEFHARGEDLDFVWIEVTGDSTRTEVIPQTEPIARENHQSLV